MRRPRATGVCPWPHMGIAANLPATGLGLIVSSAFSVGKQVAGHGVIVRRAGPLTLALIAAMQFGHAAERSQPAEHAYSNVETALLPLSVDTVAIPPALGVAPGTGGGLTVIDDTVIVVDVRGAFFALDHDTVRALMLPPIDNHAGDYERFARKPVQLGRFLVNTGFVVHDVESRKEPAGIRLFVSYERYVSELRTAALG